MAGECIMSLKVLKMIEVQRCLSVCVCVCVLKESNSVQVSAEIVENANTLVRSTRIGPQHSMHHCLRQRYPNCFLLSLESNN